MSYVIQSGGKFWQTGRGFHSAKLEDATRYPTEAEAMKVAALCVPTRVRPIISQVKD